MESDKLQEKRPETSTIDSRNHNDLAELPTAKASPQNNRVSADEHRGDKGAEERGRSTQRQPDTEPEDPEKIEDVLEDVRTRLYSVQKIVRRERSGSSQARDEMLDDLGTMLDTAIATTMTPLNTPVLQARSSFIGGRAGSVSPVRQSRPATWVSRSQSAKHVNPLHVRLTSRPALPRDSPMHGARTEGPTRVQSPENFGKPILAGSHYFDKQRDRQVSEPVTNFSLPFGFPLTSPVRERALL